MAVGGKDGTKKSTASPSEDKEVWVRHPVALIFKVQQHRETRAESCVNGENARRPPHGKTLQLLFLDTDIIRVLVPASCGDGWPYQSTVRSRKGFLKVRTLGYHLQTFAFPMNVILGRKKWFQYVGPQRSTGNETLCYLTS